MNVKRIITSKIEHHAVGHTAENLKDSHNIEVVYLTTDKKGNPSIEQLKELLKKDVKTLVSLMHANNEIGTLLPIEEVSLLCNKYENVYFHSDTVQTMGHYSFDVKKLKIDFLVCSATLLNVYYNNLLVLNYTGDIINNVFNGNPMVFWGFTASTGGASNFHQFCIDVPDLIIDSSNVVVESEKCNQENGSIIGINIVGGISPYSWTWNTQNSLSLDTFNLNGGGFFLELTDGMGCITSHNFYVPDLSGPEIDTSFVIIKNEDCGQENGAISNITVTSTADSIQFYWNNFLSDSLNISNLIADNYQLVVLDNNNCRDTSNFLLIDTNYHNISISYNSVIMEPDESIDFFQNSIDSSIINYWSFGDDSSSIEYEPTHIYKYPGDYTVCLIAANEYNCFDTSCLEITIFPSEIIIPNIFSPNNDLVNDRFVIYGINDLFNIKIYNRWGNIVFDQSPYENDWNGKSSNGKRLSDGQYFYILKNEQEDIKLNGSVMLVR